MSAQTSCLRECRVTLIPLSEAKCLTPEADDDHDDDDDEDDDGDDGIIDNLSVVQLYF